MTQCISKTFFFYISERLLYVFLILCSSSLDSLTNITCTYPKSAVLQSVSCFWMRPFWHNISITVNFKCLCHKKKEKKKKYPADQFIIDMDKMKSWPLGANAAVKGGLALGSVTSDKLFNIGFVWDSFYIEVMIIMDRLLFSHDSSNWVCNYLQWLYKNCKHWVSTE